MSQTINSTLKSSDTEETLDILFYRKIGYMIARFSASVGITPNMITIFSIFWGVLAGHLFYYQNLTLNLWGVFFLIFANSLDSADGQLARMTNNKTQLGRILDGLAGNIWFLSIYAHLLLRLLNEGYGSYVIVLCLVTGLVHIFQAAIADYYRNAHLFFIKGKSGSEFDSSEKLKAKYKAMKWSDAWFSKLFMASYINYTKEQELFTKNLQSLVTEIQRKFPETIPPRIVDSFRKDNKPLMPITNILTFNTRSIVLFISVLSGYLLVYWLFELIILTILLVYMVIKQEKISKKYLQILKNEYNS